MRYLYVVLCCLLLNCQSGKKDAPLFELQKGTGIQFANNIHNTKDFNIFSYRNFYNGGGVAIGDINNDSLPDVFFTANMGDNKLYLNKGNWQFEDITTRSGLLNRGKWGTGVVMADINHDGWLDIYVCYAGLQKEVGQENELYINNRNGTFTETAKSYGLADAGYSTHAAFFDYDLDGDLDCYILNNSFIPVNTLNYANKRELRAEDWPVADFLKGGGDKLLRNDDGKYVDVSKQANIYGSLIGFGLGVTIGDVNNDHYPDIYVSNDFFERDYLYINQKNGTYREELELWMQHTSLASMGADIGDINNDGYVDIFTTDMLPDDDYRLKTTSLFDNIDVYRLKENLGFYHQYMQNTLQLNNRNGKFMDIAYYSGVAASDWSWGGIMFDADNDGFSDLFVCNGIYQDVTNQDFIDFFANDVIQKMAMTGKKEEVDQVISKMPSYPIPNKAFRNGGNLRFSDEGKSWGLDQPSFSNGAAYGDLDNDGDLDMVISNVNQEAFVYRNNSRDASKNNYIALVLRGKDKNPYAIGSAVKLYAGGQVISRELHPSRGFQSSVDYKMILGLGTLVPDSMIITWPDRTSTTLRKPAVNQVHVLQAPGALDTVQLVMQHPARLLQPVPAVFEKHEEDEYIDFYYERGLVKMISREGPKAATADVDGDGLQDIYISGTAAKGGQLYLQRATGFVKKDQPVFSSGMEETAVLFFDADADGDADLFAGTGGNHLAAHSYAFQNRILLNDGKGNFSAGSIINTGMNTAVAAANDADADGDQDLFIGSRSIPQQYGPAPESFIMLNNGNGQFTKWNDPRGRLQQLGLVTGAAWVNVSGDAKKELVVVGEWMAPKIFSFDGKNWSELKTGLEDLAGWWQGLAHADLDADGDEDLVLGNIGENFYLRPDSANPVKMWISDFDNNGTVEKIISRTVNGKDVPVFLKKDLTDQIASLRKQNLKYEDFARKSVQELFPATVLDKARVQLFRYGSTCVAWNEGGTFKIQRLPAELQFSSTAAIVCTDMNGDGTPDIVGAGNHFHFQPQFSRLDASFGNVVINRGNRNFERMPAAQSGLMVRGEVRDIIHVQRKGAGYLLFLQNNDKPLFYQFAANNASGMVKQKITR